MNIYTQGRDDEYTIYMVKHACDEFATLTDEQALRICDLLAEISIKRGDHETNEQLQEEIYSLQNDLDNAEEDRDYYQTKAARLENEISELKDRIEELENEINK